MKKFFWFFCLLLGTASCVTQAKYNEAKQSEARLYDEARLCNEELSALQDKYDELQKKLAQTKNKVAQTQQDADRLSKELQRVQEDCTQMQTQNQDLLGKLKTAKSKEEVQAMLGEIQALQSELMRREDALFKAERALAEKQNELANQNAEILQLQNLIAQKEQMMNDFKHKIQKALTGYEGNGLEITNRGGRIYVSMDEQLLFQSGRWDVDARGQQAIRQLSEVLAKDKDINILVEGHTDNVPYRGSGTIQDNWDLSVKRATAIVRILLENPGIEPSRVTASGRSEFLPVDTNNTPEARQKNRRTEIILSPNLDELLKVLE